MRWRRRLPAIVIGSLLLAVTMASPALADPLGDAAKAVISGQSNPMLTWIQMQDSHGVSVWQYELSIDRGNPVTAPDKWFWGKLVDSTWQFYRDGVVVAIWFLQWILNFGWMDPVTAAVTPIGDALHTTMGLLGLGGLFLTIAGVVGGIYILKGRTATGVWELMAAVVVAAGLTTFLANPAGLLLAKPDGLVYRVHDTSLAFVSAMAQTPELKASGQTDAITSDLIVTFLRQPLEMVNFGVVIDGGACEAGYDEVLKSGPHAWGNEIRDKVTSCSATAGEWASTPSPTMYTAAGSLYPAVFIVLTLAIAIGGSVLMAGLSLAYQSAKANITTIAGVLPGAARRPLLGTIADVLIASAQFLFSFVFLAIFLKAIQLVLGGSGAMGAPQRIFITDLLLVAGLVIFLKNHKRIKDSAHHLRELLGRRPGGSVGVSSPTRLNTAAAISAGANVAHLARSVMRRRGGAAGAVAGSAAGWTGIVGTVAGGGAPFNGQVGGGYGGAGNSGPRRPSGSGGGGGAAVLTGRVLTGAVEMGLGHATGGASTVALTAVRALRRPKPRPELAAGHPSVSGGPVRRSLPSGPSGQGQRRALPPGPSRRPGGSVQPIALPPGPSSTPPARRPGVAPTRRGYQSRTPAPRSAPRPVPPVIQRRTGRRGGR